MIFQFLEGPGQNKTTKHSKPLQKLVKCIVKYQFFKPLNQLSDFVWTVHVQYLIRSVPMEFTGSTGKRQAKEHLVTGSKKRHEDDWVYRLAQGRVHVGW